MQRRDYILREIERLGYILARIRDRILGRTTSMDELRRDLSGAAGSIGLDLDLAHRVTPETLLLLAPPATDPSKTWFFAESLYLEGLELYLAGAHQEAAGLLRRARLLFEALRGAGGNFGVAASFTFRLHPVGPTVIGGLVAHPFERARDVLHFYRDFTANLPDELTVFAGLIHAPDGSGTKLAAMLAGHCGPTAEAEAAVRPIKEFGPPIMDALGPIEYTALNGMLDAGFPRGALNYWKSSFVADLTDEAIDTLVECFARCPSPMSGMLLEHFHGAAARVGATDTAFPHRREGFNMLIMSQWMEPGTTGDNTTWARESYAAMAPFLARGRYVNYLAHDEGAADVGAVYGPNHARLAQVKPKYDPGNLFHLNQNIRPLA